MADPTNLLVGFNMNSWTTYVIIFFGIATFAFFSGLGSEVAKYAFERWIRHRLDKVSINIKPGEVEITTKKQLKHAGTRDIYIDNKGEETYGEYRK